MTVVNVTVGGVGNGPGMYEATDAISYYERQLDLFAEALL